MKSSRKYIISMHIDSKNPFLIFQKINLSHQIKKKNLHDKLTIFKILSIFQRLLKHLQYIQQFKYLNYFIRYIIFHNFTDRSNFNKTPNSIVFKFFFA